MAAAEKFMFNSVFELREDPSAEPDDVRYAEIYGRADLDAARAEGMRAGAAQEKATHERLQAEALAAISERLAVIAQQQATTLEAIAKEATTLASTIARKIAAHLMRQQPSVELEGMIADSLQQLIDEPRVVVRVPDVLLDGLKERIDEISGSCGFTGNVVLLADPAINGSNCTIEWADGGAERDTEAIWREIDARIGTMLTGSCDASTGNPPAASTNPTDPASPTLAAPDAATSAGP